MYAPIRKLRDKVPGQPSCRALRSTGLESTCLRCRGMSRSMAMPINSSAFLVVVNAKGQEMAHGDEFQPENLHLRIRSTSIKPSRYIQTYMYIYLWR